jgi:hypothetical protein
LVSDPPSPRHRSQPSDYAELSSKQFIVSVNGAFNRIPFYS